ncbi:hypothetical protein NC652_004299 [Populus alba x Populus x berolinensis]|nr:hypothetical protein NC652_004299 [Populus alba x Populus x berolinensis]
MNFFIHDSLLAFSAGIFVISTVAAWKNWNFLLKYDISPSRPMMLVLLANLIVVLHLPFHLLLLFLTLDFTMFSLKKVYYRRETPEMGRYAS